MTRFRRLALILLLVLAVTGLIASVGVVMPRTVRVLGPDGSPVEAWAGYHYEGYRFNFVDSITYTRAGAIARTDADGNLRLAGIIYLRAPLDGWLRHRIDLLYAPALHNASVYTLTAEPRSRGFERSADGTSVHLADHADHPELWARSLGQLFAFVRHQLMSRWPQDVAADRQTVDMLARQVVADYRAFVAHHTTTPRAVPTIGMDYLDYRPAAEREATIARIREDIARTPLWGPYLEQRWGRRIAELEAEIGM